MRRVLHVCMCPGDARRRCKRCRQVWHAVNMCEPNTCWVGWSGRPASVQREYRSVNVHIASVAKIEERPSDGAGPPVDISSAPLDFVDTFDFDSLRTLFTGGALRSQGSLVSRPTCQ